MQQDAHVWAWFYWCGERYMAQPLPAPEVSRFPFLPRWLVFNQQFGKKVGI
jgi:hypothetical protein